MADRRVRLDRLRVIKDERTRETVVIRQQPRGNHQQRDELLTFHEAKRLGDIAEQRQHERRQRQRIAEFFATVLAFHLSILLPAYQPSSSEAAAWAASSLWHRRRVRNGHIDRHPCTQLARVAGQANFHAENLPHAILDGLDIARGELGGAVDLLDHTGKLVA